MSGPPLHLFLVSDSTGETINSVARACLAQFEGARPVEHFWSLVRTDAQLDAVLGDVAQHRGLVIFTLVDERLRQRLQAGCADLGVRSVSVLDPVIDALGASLGRPSQRRPGRQHALDDAYFTRLEAMNFALAHDDGLSASGLHEADVVLVGVSRTSKTPTALYLANRGIRAANVPYVPNCPLPTELEELTRPLVVGLTCDPEQLILIRRSRIRMLARGETPYIDPAVVQAEVVEARRLFARRGWPTIDVTRRAIEETAAEILGLLNRRRMPAA